MKAVLLNGPPGCGKDTIGAMLSRMVRSAGCMKFSEPIRSHLMSAFGIDMDLVEKDVPNSFLHGCTPREVAIRYSEGFIKPLFGQSFFGHRLGMRMRAMVGEPSLVFITDSGFLQEAEALAGVIGNGNLLQVMITRTGKTFHGDSRSYWTSDKIGWISFDNDAPNLIELEKKVAADLAPEIQAWASF